MQIDPNSVQWDDAPTPVRAAPSFPGIIRGAPPAPKEAPLPAPTRETETWVRMTPEEVKSEGLNPNQTYQRNLAGKIEPVGGAIAPQVDPNRPLQIKSAMDALSNIRSLAEKTLSVGKQAGRVADFPVVGGFLGQNRADLEASLALVEGNLIQDQLARLAKINPGGVASLANSETEARRLASAVANLDPNQSEEEFIRGVDRAENYYREQAKQLGIEIPQAQSTPVAITSGESFSTDQDKAIAAAVQSAFQQGGGVQELKAAAEQAGGQVRPEDLASFQQAIEARDKKQSVTFNPQKTGRRSPVAQAAGEALMTPAGTAVTGAVNAAGIGALSLFAGDQVQGLEALNPKSAVIGEIAGSALGTGALAAGARQGIGRVSSTLAERLAGGGMKGALARTAATDAAYGGIYAANTGEDVGTGVALGALGSLVGAGVGAGVKRAAPAFRGMFRGNGDEALPPFDGGPGGGTQPIAGATDSAAPSTAPVDEPFIPTTTRSNDAGASGTSGEAMRLSQAEGLPVPVELTRGAAARDADQLAFEKEQIFGPLGAPLRTRAEENNLQVLQNFDRFIDLTGAQAPDIPSTGNAVIKALSQGYKQAKDRVNVAYKRAEVAGDMAEPVSYKEIADFIAEQTPTTREKLAPVLNAVSEQLRKNDPDGTGQIPINALEDVRKLINKATTPGTADANYGGELKGLIDQATEGKGGALYKKARALRIEQARKFENRAVVERLVASVKNKADAKTESNKVFERSILNESPEDIKFLRHALKTSGPEGRQAWKELQGATIRHIQDAATSNVNLTSTNEKVVSAAGLNKVVEKLDKNGRLDAIFDPATAQRIRDLRDVVQYVNTVPPGTSINNSGTARTLLAAMAEMGGMGAMTGVPLPLVTGLKALRGAVQDNRIKKKIAQSLMPREE